MTTSAHTSEFAPEPAGAIFRTCPATGRHIHLGAERLIKVHAVASVVSLLIGAVAAVLLVLTRWQAVHLLPAVDRKSTRLNSSHSQISYAVFCLKKKKKKLTNTR